MVITFGVDNGIVVDKYVIFHISQCGKDAPYAPINLHLPD